SLVQLCLGLVIIPHVLGDGVVVILPLGHKLLLVVGSLQVLLKILPVTIKEALHQYLLKCPYFPVTGFCLVLREPGLGHPVLWTLPPQQVAMSPPYLQRTARSHHCQE
ncbi:hypothetical protein JZ751_001666, partial [Albula glossodonta]